jgi:hypothetical protein
MEKISIKLSNSNVHVLINDVYRYEGIVDKLTGDGLMALFGAPVPQEDHALRAVRVGLDMQTEYQTLMKRWQERGVAATPIGIGIATGEMTAGEMGGPQRTNYTVIGRAVNLGSRICGVAKGNQVLMVSGTDDHGTPITIRADRAGTALIRGDVDVSGFRRVEGTRYVYWTKFKRRVEGIGERSSHYIYAPVTSLADLDQTTGAKRRAGPIRLPARGPDPIGIDQAIPRPGRGRQRQNSGSAAGA